MKYVLRNVTPQERAAQREAAQKVLSLVLDAMDALPSPLPNLLFQDVKDQLEGSLPMLSFMVNPNSPSLREALEALARP